MKAVKFVASIVFAAALGGCAQVKTVTSKLDYSTGTYVSPQQLDALKSDKTTQDEIVKTIGYPTQKAEIMGKEVWTYTYTLIPALPFDENKFENTVFEFNTKGALVNAYKSGGTPGQSGNPLLNAAGM